MFQPIAVLFDADGCIRGMRAAFFDVDGINASDKLYFPRLFECPAFAQRIRNFRIVDCNAQQCLELSSKFHYRERLGTKLSYDSDYDEISDESDDNYNVFRCTGFESNPDRLRSIYAPHCYMSAIDANNNIVTQLLGKEQPLYFQVIGAHVRKIVFTYVNDTEYYRNKVIRPEYKIYDANPFFESNPAIKQLLPSKVILIAPNGKYQVCEAEQVKQMAKSNKIRLGNLLYDKKNDCLGQQYMYSTEYASDARYSLGYKDTVTDMAMSASCNMNTTGYAVITNLPDSDVVVFPPDCPPISIYNSMTSTNLRCKQLRFPAVSRSNIYLQAPLELRALVLPTECYGALNISVQSIANIAFPKLVETNRFEFKVMGVLGAKGIDCSKYIVGNFDFVAQVPECTAMLAPTSPNTRVLLYNAKSLKAIAFAQSLNPADVTLSIHEISNDLTINLGAYCKHFTLELGAIKPGIKVVINHNGIGVLRVSNVADMNVPAIDVVTNSVSLNTINSKQVSPLINYSCIRKRKV